MKAGCKNLLVLLIATLATLGLLELGIRSLNRYLGHYPQKDPILHHSLVPNAKLRRTNDEFDVVYQINSLGLRDQEISLGKPAQTFRILMLGDSYTFGIGANLEDTFVKRLEHKLNQKGGKVHFEVINGGCSSYAPILEYLLLIHKGLALHPDLVILNYDISDVQDDYKYGEIAKFDDHGKPLKVPPIDVQWYHREIRHGFRSRIPWLKDSDLYQFVMKRYYQVKGTRDAPVFSEAALVVAGDIDYDRMLPLREHAGDWKPYFQQSARYLKLIKELLQSRQIPFVLSSYPYGNQISIDEWETGRALRGFETKVYHTQLFDYLREFSQREGVPYLDMFPDFLTAKKQAPTTRLFYPYDGHFTPQGHEVAATALEQFLQQRPLIP